jgi:tRNA dimethylallyltransferase
LAEVAAARRRYPAADPELAGFRALGFRELAGHLDGRLSVAEATAAAQQATRNYAKRQGTWFRHQLRNAILLFPGGAAMKFSQSSLAEMRHKIRDFLLTHSS